MRWSQLARRRPEKLAAVRGADTEEPQANKEPESQQPKANILDLSHVNVAASTDVAHFTDAVARYGQVPGGIVVEGKATCDFAIESLSIDAKHPTHLVINGSRRFDSGLTVEEVVLLWQAVFETNQATDKFGVLSQTQAIGIGSDTVVAGQMMLADNWLGGVAYGYDSQMRLGKPTVDRYHNPFVADASSATQPNELKRLCFNYLYDLSPRLFLRVAKTHFAPLGVGGVSVASTSITAPTGVLGESGEVLTSIPNDHGDIPLVVARFPAIYQTFQDFVARFTTYAPTEPCLARSIAYAELVMLLRLAKSSGARLSAGDHYRTALAGRKHVQVPRFNHTLRTNDFTEVARNAAAALTSYVSHDPTDGSMAAILGFHYATLAGDCRRFLECKRKARDLLTALQRGGSDGHSSVELRELRRLAPEIKDSLQLLSHDILIPNRIAAALASTRTEETEQYLREAIHLSPADTLVSDNSGTRCRWVESNSYLDPAFDATRELAKVRLDDPATSQPYRSLNTIVCHRLKIGSESPTVVRARKQAIGVQNLSILLPNAWQAIETTLSTREYVFLLEELQRFNVSAADLLVAVQLKPTFRPLDVLENLVANKLKPLPATTFYTHYLSRFSPFAFSHELLKHESLSRLQSFYLTIKSTIDPDGLVSELVQGRSRRFLLPSARPMSRTEVVHSGSSAV